MSDYFDGIRIKKSTFKKNFETDWGLALRDDIPGTDDYLLDSHIPISGCKKTVISLFDDEEDDAPEGAIVLDI